MENNENREGFQIDLMRIFSVLWSKLWIVVMMGVLLGAIALSYAMFFVTPTYASSVLLYVNNQYADSPGFSSSQLTAAQNLAATYMVILESRSVLEEVNETAGLNYTYSQLKGMVVAASVNETEAFSVSVVSVDPHHAYLLANAVADVLPAKINAVVDGSSVRVVDYAVENPSPIGPNYRKYLTMGAVTGILLSAVLIIGADLLDTTIHSEAYLAYAYEDIPLLAVVTDSESSKSGYKGYYEAAHEKATGKKTGGAK